MNKRKVPAYVNPNTPDDEKSFSVWSTLRSTHTHRAEYFNKYSDEIAQQNYEIIKLLSIISLGLLFVFLVVANCLIPAWHITSAHILMAPAMAAFLLFTLVCPKKLRKTRSFMNVITMLFMATLLGFIVAIDLLTVSDGAAVFLPALYVSLSTVFVLPAFCSMPVFIAAEIAFVIGTITLKSFPTAATDIFASLFGLALAVLTGYLISGMTTNENIRFRHYRRLSRLDQLTGVLNKATTEDSVRFYLDGRGSDERCVLYVTDIDDFKHINDNCGHQEGDRALVCFGEALRTRFSSDDIVGRIGGDEFLILQKNVPQDFDPAQTCAEFRKVVSGISEKKNIVSINFSIGAAILANGSIQYSELFHIADDALYFAKSSGKGRDEIRIVGESSSKPLLLLADGDGVSRTALCSALSSGYDIIIAKNRDDILDLMNRYGNRLSLVVIDVSSPQTGGLFELEHIRSIGNHPGVRVIAIADDAESESKALSLHADDVILRPVDCAHIVSLIDGISGRHKAGSRE